MTHGKAHTTPRSTLVITAHAGDFVWRAGGSHRPGRLPWREGDHRGASPTRERGESAKAWREGNSLEEIKEIRRAEARRRPRPWAPGCASSTSATTPCLSPRS